VVLDPSLVPPAPGQGALAVQVRRDDSRVVEAVSALDDPDTRHAVEVERAILAGAGGGCRAPLGALARVHGATLSVTVGYARPEGDVVARAAASRPLRDRAHLVDAVLADLAGSAVAAASANGWPEVIVTRPDRQAAGLLLSMVDAGLAPRSVPTIEVELCHSLGLDDALADLGRYTWVVLTSANSVRAIDAAARRLGVDPGRQGRGTGAGPRWAVVGRTTARELALLGVEADLRPDAAGENAAELARRLPLEPGDTVLLPRSSLASPELPAALRGRGATVDDVTAYATWVAPASSRRLLEASMGRQPRAAVVASPSAAQGLLELAEQIGVAPQVRALPIVVPGSTTAAAVRAAGFDTVHVAQSPSPADVASATTRAVATHQETR
jgi:uroporphyrinogen-III synthase